MSLRIVEDESVVFVADDAAAAGADGTGAGGENINPSDAKLFDVGKPMAEAGRTIDRKFAAGIEGLRRRCGCIKLLF